MQLRSYQSKAIDLVEQAWDADPTAVPCLSMPGGSGKSVVVAELARREASRQGRVLMLVHSRELVAQNAERLQAIWPEAPLGVFCAGLGRRELRRVTYGTPTSIRAAVEFMPRPDLIIVDEAHALNNEDQGLYRSLINDLWKDGQRVVGLTASPYRLGQGMVTDGTLFNRLIEPVTISELVEEGSLAPLRSKHTDLELSHDGLKLSGGEYTLKSQGEAWDQHVEAIVEETCRRAASRRHWLVFSPTVEHAEHMAAAFRSRGITAATVTGKTPTGERDRLLADFKAGRIRCLTNVGVLTTGFDFPALDCIVMARATKSPGLYLQMAVRGMRIHPGKDDCLVLDFAGLVKEHGPVTRIRPPQKAGKGQGEAPSKVCPQCAEIVHASARQCPACGHEFPPAEKEAPRLHAQDIMGLEPTTSAVESWAWRVHKSRKTGQSMLMVTYSLRDGGAVVEWIAGPQAERTLQAIVRGSRCPWTDGLSLWQQAERLNMALPPISIDHKPAGKYDRVLRRVFASVPF